jgi:hypothetical protein
VVVVVQWRFWPPKYPNPILQRKGLSDESVLGCGGDTGGAATTMPASSLSSS